MKYLFTFILALFTVMQSYAQEEYNPVADPDAVVQSGNTRFTVLTPQMIRIQYSSKKVFEDRATFAVVNRRLPVPAFTTSEEDGYLYIKTEAVTLKYRTGSNPTTLRNRPEFLSVTFNMNGHEVMWYPGKDDALNLKGTTRTLDNGRGDSKRGELENGILSRGGWALIDESASAKRGDGSRTFAFEPMEEGGMDWAKPLADESATDWYILCYGHDYKKALGDYVKIAGRIPMPPDYMFGYWYSKYQRYTAQDFMDITMDIENNRIPIDIMIMDMDWHKDGWTGWSWNTSLIPDPKGLINWMHQHNMKVSLNLHPADGVNNYEDNFAQMCADLGKDPGTTTNIPWQLEDYNFYKAMFKNIIRLRESEGVDFWWIDWQQRLTNNNLAGLGETFWCNHVFYEDMRLNRPEHRPVIFHRWGGLGSHRYPIGFSGDTFATFPTLAFQPYFTATASNVGFGYWGHDLGGHQQPGDNDPELYLRWMQFGVFTPIFRTHATNAANIERRIWVYENFPSLLKTVQLRYAMFPYIYTAAREAYDTGVSMCRPLYYDHPEDANAYKYEDEYMFGNDILVAPIVTPADADKTVRRTVWLPEGKWWNVCRSKMMDGNVTFTDTYGQEDIPYFYKAGSIIVNNPPQKSVTTKAQTLILKVVPGADGSYSLYEDEGDTELYKDGVFSRTEFTQTRNAQSVTLNIGARTGVYPGMPDERAYRAEFIGSEKPERVLINGNEAASGTWSYDSDNRTVTVNIPTASCDVTTAIELRYAVLQSELTGINGTENGATSIEYNAQDGTVTAHLAATAKNAKLEIVSANGSETCTATGTDCNSITADISSLGRGTYVCRITVDGKSVTRKIVK